MAKNNFTIANACNQPLFAKSGTVPDVSGALKDYFQSMVFTPVLKSTIGFQAFELGNPINFWGVIMPMSPRELKLLPEGERAWSLFELYAEPSLTLQVDDVVMWNGKQTRVMRRKDYGLYGYVVYALCQDFTRKWARMSALSLASTLTAVSPNLTSSFLASGGVGPYTYSVRANGAGGAINSSTGLYTAPASVGETPQTLVDTIQVVDSTTPTPIVATAQLLVGTPVHLFCDILQTVLGLAPGRVYLFDQKIFQPTDSGLYIAVSVPRCRPFGSNNQTDSTGQNSIQTVNFLTTVDMDLISRGPAALIQKEEALAAVLSNYSLTQQEANSFQISRLTSSFINLSMVDGAAIPYRYKMTFNLTYAQTFTNAVPYFSSIANPPTVYTNP